MRLLFLLLLALPAAAQERKIIDDLTAERHFLLHAAGDGRLLQGLPLADQQAARPILRDFREQYKAMVMEYYDVLTGKKPGRLSDGFFRQSVIDEWFWQRDLAVRNCWRVLASALTHEGFE